MHISAQEEARLFFVFAEVIAHWSHRHVGRKKYQSDCNGIPLLKEVTTTDRIRMTRSKSQTPNQGESPPHVDIDKLMLVWWSLCVCVEVINVCINMLRRRGSRVRWWWTEWQCRRQRSWQGVRWGARQPSSFAYRHRPWGQIWYQRRSLQVGSVLVKEKEIEISSVVHA